MIIFRILLGLLAIPLVLFLWFIKIMCIIFTGIGQIVTSIIGGFMVLGGICFILFGAGFWAGLGTLGGGILICALPFIGVAIVAFIDLVIGWIWGFVFGN